MSAEFSSQIQIMAPELPTAEEIYPYLKKIDSNQIYSNFGPLEQELRMRMSSHFGVPISAVATCANATLAMLGAIETSGANLETIWELPAWTFTATASSVLGSRYAAQFVDVDLDGRIQPTPEAKAIIDVLPFGEDWNYSRLDDSIDFTIVDAAASFDAIKKLPMSKEKPFALIISLHATKILPAGEGAVLISNNVEWVRRFQSWTKFGMEVGRISSFLGSNAKLNEYNAAVALASLDAWPKVRERWRLLSDEARRVSQAFNLEYSSALKKGFITPYWILNLETAINKDFFAEICRNLGIETRNWWESGCHKMAAYDVIPRLDLPVTDLLASQTIALPFHLGLVKEDWNRIEKALQNYRTKRDSNFEDSFK